MNFRDRTQCGTIALLALICITQICLAQTPPDEADRLLAQALSLEQAGRLAEAEAPLERAAAAAPTNTTVLTALGKLKALLAERPEAVQIFRRVVAESPRSAQAHLNLAIALADTGATQSALEEATLSVSLEPTLVAAHTNRARLLADLGKRAQARTEFAAAAKLEPNNAGIYLYWASLEQEQEDFPAAARLLTKAVAFEPNNARAQYQLGKCLATLGREREAIAALHRAVELDPRSSESVYALAQALRTADPEQSRQLLERFHRLQADKLLLDQLATIGNQAYAATQAKDWTRAVDLLSGAIDRCQGCALQPELLKQRGLARAHAGDLPGGQADLQQALALRPGDKATEGAIEQIDRLLHGSSGRSPTDR